MLLDKLYRCRLCRLGFIFESDKDDHIQQTNHSDFETYNLIGPSLISDNDLSDKNRYLPDSKVDGRETK